jgi:hypothetical protein
MIVKKIILLIFITILLLISSEFITRFFGNLHYAADSYIPDPIVNHRLKPDHLYVDTTTRVRPFSFDVSKQSWVGKKVVQFNKSPNTTRIFYIGDSTTMGLVSEKNKMPSIVSKELNKKLNPTGKKVEVINAGTGGWGTIMYYLEIKNKILKYSPDIVVIDFDMTDVRDDGIYKKYTTFDKDKLPVSIRPADQDDKSSYIIAPGGLVKISKTRSVLSQISSHSALYYYLTQLSIRLRQNDFLRGLFHKPKFDKTPAIDNTSWLSLTYSETAIQNISYSMFLLENTIKLLRSHNARFAHFQSGS